MPIFGTEYVLSTAAQAGNIALADNEYIRGSFKEYATSADLSYSASNFPDRFSTGQIVYISQSNELFRISIVYDEINEINVFTTQSFSFPGGGGSTDISALNTFTASIQIQVNSLTDETSSYALKTDISGAFASVSSSVSTRLTSLEAGGGNVPDGTISSSTQISDFGFISSSQAIATDISGAFTALSSSITTRLTAVEGVSGGDVTALNLFTGSIQSEVNNLTSATSSYGLKTDISGAFTSVSGGLAGRITTLEGTSGGDVTALNLFTGSIQTQVDNLTAETSSYLTSADTSSFVLNSQTASFIVVGQTSSMSVLNAVTASYIDPSFISASAAAAGFGSGGGAATDISALNTFTGSIQTQVDNLTAETSSYLTSADTASFVTISQTSSMSVATASYVDPTFDYVDFTDSSVSSQVRRLSWNDADGTLDLGVGYGDVVLQLGQEQHFVVRNATGTIIENGTAVYASGLSAGAKRIEASPFTADGNVREVRFLGLATHDISDGVNGVVTHFGYVRGLDTRGTSTTAISVGDENWSEGDILYAHPTVAGKLTNIPPKHRIYVAIVTTKNQTTGVLFVRPSSFGHLNDIHDVSINTSSLATGNVLVYNSLSDVWENSNSVNLATTASYIDPTFISASAAASGFGSGGGASIPNGTISGSQQITDLGFINQSQTSSMSVLSALTASFVGNLNYDYITNLPNLISSSAQIALLGAGILSASAQIASDISGAFTSLSSSFASRITALEGAGGGSGIFTLTGSFYSTTNNIQITGSLSVGSGSFKSFEVDSDGFVVLGDMDKDLNNAPVGTIAYSGSSFYLIS